MRKVANKELAAMLTLLTVAAGNAAMASPTQPSNKVSSGTNPFLIAEHQTSSKTGADSSCGEGMCSTKEAKQSKKKAQSEKGMEGSCKGKDNSCKSKEMSCKGKEMSCKGKDSN